MLHSGVRAQTQTHIKDYTGHLLMPSPFQKTAWNRPQAVRLLSISGQRKSEGGSLLSSRDTWGISLRIDKARVVGLVFHHPGSAIEQ